MTNFCDRGNSKQISETLKDWYILVRYICNDDVPASLEKIFARDEKFVYNICSFNLHKLDQWILSTCTDYKVLSSLCEYRVVLHGNRTLMSRRWTLKV